MKICSYEGDTKLMCIYTENSDLIFSLGVTPLLNLEIWPKLNVLMKQFAGVDPGFDVGGTKFGKGLGTA